jgi:hypothetical protein
MKGSGARSSVRTTEVPADDRRLDITKILGSGGRSPDTLMAEIEAESSNTRGSGARSSVRTMEVPVDVRRLDITGGRLSDTSMVVIEAVSSNTMLGLLVGLPMRRGDLSDGMGEIDLMVDELLMDEDGESDRIEHVDGA